MSINIVTLSGNLTKDPEVSKTNSGKSMTRCSIGVRKNFKNADGNYDSIFVNLKAFGYTADHLAKAIKGDTVTVTGSLDISQYKDRSGNNKDWTEVLVNEAVIPNRNKNNGTIRKNEVTADFYRGHTEGYQSMDSDIEINPDDLPY